uniref:Uncharacterized protein n=1 Tax=viral metagenome TaxID=1070528 RepID=A0A6C0H3Y0_9ZZZZ
MVNRTLKKKQTNKSIFNKLRSISYRRMGRGKEASYRMPFVVSLRKLSNFTRKKEAPAPAPAPAQNTASVPISSFKIGKSNTKKKVVLHQESKAWQNICSPNKKVIFTKGKVPAFEYLENINKEGSLGCAMKTFPKYENGKYCCMSEPSSKQENLDFINSLLEAAMNNVSDTAFIRQRTKIYSLLRSRKFLLRNNKLIDTLQVIEPYTSITDWFIQTEERAGKEISKNRPDPIIDDDPIHIRIQDEVARNKIKNKKYMLKLKTLREKKQAWKARLGLWKSRASTLVKKAKSLIHMPMRIVSVK